MKATMKRIFRRTVALTLCAGLIAAGGSFAGADYSSQIEELENRRYQLAQEKKQAEADLAAFEEGARESAEYMEIYDEKMHIQEEEITNLKEQISILDTDIEATSRLIASKEVEIAQDIEDFKQRLRVMYMEGSDSLASILVGSTDFYDVLVRTELMERVSRHDNQMIDDLNTKINELIAEKDKLEEDMTALEEKKADSEEVLSELQETYNDHVEMKAYYEEQAQALRERTPEMMAEADDVEEELQKYIRLQQEENERLEAERRAREEKERKEREERERKEREEQERREREQREREEYEARMAAAQEEADSYYQPSEDTTSYAEPEVSYSSTYGQSDEYGDDYDSLYESSESDSYSSGSSDFIWPCPTVYNMTDGYGYRTIDEEGGSSDFHKGIDITKPGCAGEKIVASASGKVITASNTGNGYGIHVVIDHGGKIATLYAHMSECTVSVGDYVEQGQTIGYIGCTGYAYGNHCHFEVRVNGQHTDPLNYVSM